MEATIGNERIVEGNNATAPSPGSGSGSLKQVADPVVYKLVRVDFDGSFVPATDDELIEVEDFLDYGKGEMLSVADVVEAVGCSSAGNDYSVNKTSEAYDGLNAKNSEVDAKKLDMQLQETLLTSTSSLDNLQANQSASLAERSNPQKGGKEHRSYDTAVGFKPDFSRLKGEINLDILTIRELQETFKATFGRETSVKDKQWLKRRIAMGLTHSCDFSVASFLIKDNKYVNKVDDKPSKIEDGMDSMGGVGGNGNGVPVRCTNGTVDTATVVKVDSSVESVQRDDTLQERDDTLQEHRAAKRLRKPTKRYIEELSDFDSKLCNERPISAVKHSGNSKDLPKQAAGSALGAQSKAMIMRPDTIGGSGVHVPYVSRIRSCRPRKIVRSISRFQPRSFGLSRKLGPDVSRVYNSLRGGGNKLVARSVPFEEPVAYEEEDKQSAITATAENLQERDAKPVESSENSSDDNSNPPGSFTVKAGMRRKHHRAWTLTEVVKLVDGVSKYGAGRWSEIKKVAFASYSHRTSVDLKDKWRNLLKASFASTPLEKGTISRKNAATPIPVQILLKVRELAEINGQVPRNFGASSGNKASGMTVNENISGIL